MGRLIQAREHVRFSWLHTFYSLFVLVLMIQFWWGFWNYRVVEDWTFVSLLAVIVEAIIMVLCAIVICVRPRGVEPIDLEQQFFSNARPFFLLASLLMALLTIVDVWVLELPLTDRENLVRIGAGGLALSAGLIKNPTFHRIMPLASTVLLLVFISVAAVK